VVYTFCATLYIKILILTFQSGRGPYLLFCESTIAK